LVATTILRLDLHEVSVKERTGPPDDDPEDLGLSYWAGALSLVTSPGTHNRATIYRTASRYLSASPRGSDHALCRGS
jgi:hypothetical protein